MSNVNKDTYSSFLNDVLAKVPDDQRSAIEEAFKHDAVAPLLRDAVLARSDYSRSMDEFNREVEEARAQIQQWQDWYASEVETAAERQARLEKYQELYGDVDDEPGNPGNHPTKTSAKETTVAGIDEKQLMTTLATRDQAAMQFADILTDLKLDHREKYGERLDTNALMDYATRNGVNIQEAYRAITEPREQKLREKELADAVSRAKEEGRREALTEHKLPVGPPRREPHFLERTDVVKDPRGRVAAAVAAFNAGMAGR